MTRPGSNKAKNASNSSRADEQAVFLMAVREKRREAFACLEQSYGPRLMSFIEGKAFQMDLGFGEADRFYQDVWVKLYNCNGAEIKGDNPFNYLCSVAMNLMRDYYRSRKLLDSLDGLKESLTDSDNDTLPEDLEGVEERTPFDLVSRRDDAVFVRNLIQKLAPIDRQVLYLSILGNKEYKDYARSLGMNPITFRVRAHRLRKEILTEARRML